MSPADKGPGAAPTYTASQTSSLSIALLHSRWNAPIITSLVSAAHSALLSSGVPASNITIQSVPGAYELPLAAQRMLAASSVSSSAALVGSAGDLLGGVGASVGDVVRDVKDAVNTGVSGGDAVAVGAADASDPNPTNPSQSNAIKSDLPKNNNARAAGPFDAIIAIGVLIKGSTMHFEYISDAVSHGLMRLSLDSGVPVVFGVLTCLTEAQARSRAGLPEHEKEEEDDDGDDNVAESGDAGEEQKEKENSKKEGESEEAKGVRLAESAMANFNLNNSKDKDKDNKISSSNNNNTKSQPKAKAEAHGHNHGTDWGLAAVEMGVKRRAWLEGRFVA